MHQWIEGEWGRSLAYSFKFHPENAGESVNDLEKFAEKSEVLTGWNTEENWSIYLPGEGENPTCFVVGVEPVKFLLE